MTAQVTAPAAPAPTTTQPVQAGASGGSNLRPETAPTPAEVRKLKLKMDGQEVEMPENEVIALAQQGKVAGKRFQEASELRKQAEDLIKFAKDNPRNFFEKTGLDIRKFSEDYLIEQLEKEQMTPEQKKARENEDKLKKYEADSKAAEDARKAQELEALQKHHAENYNKLFIDALGKSGLPKTPYTVKRMAELQLINLKNKFELQPDQLAKVVREDYINEQKALFGATEGDQLLEILGPEIMKKLSKAQIAKLKAKGVRTQQGAAIKPSSGKELSWREYQLKNRGRLK